MNNVEVLIISNKFDLTTDYVCQELEKTGCTYLRLNRDCFGEYKIVIDIQKQEMLVKIQNYDYLVSEENLQSVYFRAPTFVRVFTDKILDLEEQMYISQWNAFVRNLMIFENVMWINNPGATYAAENKLLQLKYAAKIGFNIPITHVTNDNSITIDKNTEYIVKSIDTAHFKSKNNEFFAFSSLFSGSEIKNSDLRNAPIFIQEYLEPKIDLRVTVIGEKLYCTSILRNNKGVSGDWRKQKDLVSFSNFQLPIEIKILCISLVKKFNLTFGAIDLALVDNIYYFIEINPTGEWAWLVEACDQKTYIDIVNLLIENK